MTSCLSWSGCWLSFKLLGQSCLFFFVIGWNLTVWWHVKNSWKEGTAVHCSGACHWAMSVCFSLHYFNSVRCFQIKNQAVCWNALPASLRLFRNRRFYGISAQIVMFETHIMLRKFKVKGYINGCYIMLRGRLKFLTFLVLMGTLYEKQ